VEVYRCCYPLNEASFMMEASYLLPAVGGAAARPLRDAHSSRDARAEQDATTLAELLIQRAQVTEDGVAGADELPGEVPARGSGGHR
jgi:hypothetical protein